MIDRWTLFQTIVNAHSAALLATGFLAIVLTFLPQVWRPLSELPQGLRKQIAFALLSVGLLVWSVLIAASFVVDDFDRLLTSVPMAWLWRSMVAVPTRWLFTLVDALEPFSGGTLGWVLPLLLISAGALACYKIPIRPWLRHRWGRRLDRIYPLAGGGLRIVAMLILVTNVWLLIGKTLGPQRVLHRSAASTVDAVNSVAIVWQRSGQAIALVAFVLIVGEIVWMACHHRWLGSALRLYNAWSMFSLFCIAISVASLADYLQVQTAIPGRWILMVAVIAWLSFTRLVHLEQSPAGRSDDPTDSSSWWLNDWTKDLPPDQPLVFLAASGGGSRAAMFAALAIQKIEDWFKTKQPRNRIGLVSSVSGGSMATARHFRRRPQDATANVVDDMAIDFMAPLFRGMFVPLHNRGEHLSEFWNHLFGWDQIRSVAVADLASVSSVASVEPITPVLINAADIHSGRRMIVGFPEVPPNWLPWRTDGEPTIDATNGHSRLYRPYSISSLKAARSSGRFHRSRPEAPVAAAFAPSLTRAVRMSSSFPFGFSPTQAIIQASPAKSADPETIAFLDGGVVDNTGLDSIAALVAGLVRQARDSRNVDAIRCLGRLRLRGILLIEIDAGRRPGATALEGLFSRVRQPIGALSRATHASALRSVDDHTDQIKANLGGEDIADACAVELGRRDDVAAMRFPGFCRWGRPRGPSPDFVSSSGRRWQPSHDGAFADPIGSATDQRCFRPRKPGRE